MTVENIDKNRLRDDLVAHLGGSVQQDDAEIALRRQDAEPIREDEHRVDDVSQQDEAGDLHALFQEVDDKQVELVKAATALDVSAKSRVEPGAVVEMSGERFIIGVASDEFTSGGATYSGMSTQAPIYAAMAGATAGTSVEFNGRTVTIDAVA